MIRRLLALATLSIQLAACGLPPAYVPTPPPRSAPLEQRVQAYEQLAPSAQVIETHVGMTANRTPYAFQTSTMVLRNGTSIETAEELEPAVPAQSASGAAIRRFKAAQSRRRTWNRIGLATMAAGLALSTVGLLQFASRTDEPGTPSVPPMLYVGVGLTLASSIVFIGPALHHGRVAARENQAALATYDASLREGLGLCISGLQLVDCDAPPAVPAAPAGVPAAAPAPAPTGPVPATP